MPERPTVIIEDREHPIKRTEARDKVVGRPSVLIIDDDHQITFATCVRLRAAGFLPKSANSASEGLATAIRTRPDLILLDIRMPNMDGLSLIRHLRSEQGTRHIPIIVVSASVRDQEKALAAGANFFIKKPFSGQALVDVVRRVTSDTASSFSNAEVATK